MKILDSQGNLLATSVPRPQTGAFYRKAYTYAMVENPLTREYEKQLVRAQLPHVVTLLTYSSKFQTVATRREYYVYAPADLRSAVQLAILLWKKWERGPKPLEIEMKGNTEDWFPKFEDGAVAEIIDDNTFEEQWRAASVRKHRAEGHPGDPFAFTCFDQDVMLYKVTDFQNGLSVRV